jgi:hypothetical protein
LISLAVTLLLMAAVLFLSAGTLQWRHGQLFLLVFLFLTLVAIAWLWRVNPEIFVARRQPTGLGTKSWDRVLLLILLPTFLAILIVSALDDGRYHGAPAPPWAVLIGYVLFLAGYLGSGWARAVSPACAFSRIAITM